MSNLKHGFHRLDAWRWEIPRQGAMRVPGMIYASEKMLPQIASDKASQQVANVAQLPGIAGKSLAMPDIHWGYGFPVGGVAAMDLESGVISPGGVGYDISCGVRLLRSDLQWPDVNLSLARLMDALFQNIPSGVGSSGPIHLNNNDMRRVLELGAPWAIKQGYGWSQDVDTIEDAGFLTQADPSLVSNRAIERGSNQLGTLGSGNHFLEVQRVDEIYDERIAGVFGLFQNQIVILIHTGSRGCGYQICDDFLQVMQRAGGKYQIKLPDRQLASVPLASPEGKNYFAAMCAGANFARANRQVITHGVRQGFEKIFGRSAQDLGLGVVYDVCHNIAKIEDHDIGGEKKKLCVHRKGATRAFPAGHPEVPVKYRNVGQPVIVPGSMGTASYVLVGTEKAMQESYGTTCHGAGRRMSRTQAAKQIEGKKLEQDLRTQGILVRTANYKGLAEEAPFAYKDVAEVVTVCHEAGISRKVARLRPLGVVKG